MAAPLVVPVVDVQNDNFKELWPAMVVAIKTSSFIALDTELSGLGNRKSLLAESIEDRYKAICHAARSRSVLSLGIACYKKLEDKAPDSYLVQVFNLTLLCSEEYVIEPQSVHFLVQHGFDFNKQYARGIPYCKGNGKGGADNCGVHIRTLFTELLRARKPLVLHNGLIDIAFLYQSFYAFLPERLATFTADLCDMFPAGIYDTKYVTEFDLRLTASYLEYAYKKCKLDNSRGLSAGDGGAHVHVDFCTYAGKMSDYVDYRECPDVASSETQAEVCQRFSAFGWCPNGPHCPQSHDTDLIILQDEKGQRKKRKRPRGKKKKAGEAAGEAEGDAYVCDGAPESKKSHLEAEREAAAGDPQGTAAQEDGEGDMDGGGGVKAEEEGSEARHVKTNSAPSGEATDGTGRSEEPEHADLRVKTEKNLDAGTHRAGFDAFMTGYIFAFSCTAIKKEDADAATAGEREEWLPGSVNKIYLSGKAAPLNIVKSTFAKSSKAHVQKMLMVWGRRQ